MSEQKKVLVASMEGIDIDVFLETKHCIKLGLGDERTIAIPSAPIKGVEIISEALK